MTATNLKSLIGQAVFHGSPFYETPEVVESIDALDGFDRISFASGCFTDIHRADLLRLVRDGNSDYFREGGGSLRGAYESIILA